MKLSMSLIGKYLERYAPECRIQEDGLTIRGVRFLSDLRPQYSREYVYIGSGGGYFQDPRYADTLILTSGQNYILCRGSDTEELLNDVLSAFDFYNGAEQRLTAMSARRRPLSEMTAEIAGLLPGPLLVFGLDGRLLAAAHPDRLNDPYLLKTIRNGETISLRGIGDVLVDSAGQVSHDLTDQPQHLHPAGQESLGAVSMYLIRGGERVGFLMYFPGELSEVALAVSLEPMLAACLMEAREFTDAASPYQARHSAMQHLLSGAAVPSELCRKLEQHVHMVSGLSLMAFRSVAIQNRTMRTVLMNELEASEIPCLTGEWEELVVILVDEKRTRPMTDLLRTKLPEANLSLGISMGIQRIELLPAACRQAVFALNAEDGPGVRSCRELALPYLLQTLRKQEMAADLIHPAIGILTRYDIETEGELLATLRSYVDSGCRQAETAQMLHIHLNTLKYRLRRIQELTGVDGKDPEEIFYLRLSFHLL